MKWFASSVVKIYQSKTVNGKKVKSTVTERPMTKAEEAEFGEIVGDLEATLDRMAKRFDRWS